MRFASLIFAGLLASSLLPTVVNAETANPQLQDIERYLLLYSATGDERFLQRLDKLGAAFEKNLDAQKNSTVLKDMWHLYQQALEQVRAAYSQHGVDLKTAVAQTAEVAGLFDKFIVADEGAPVAPSLADDLRALALLEARQANNKLRGGGYAEDVERIAQLQANVEKRYTALPAGESRDTLLSRWSYLRKSERPDGATLLYPFNAQIEYLLEHLPQG
ncbi:hypothetical protein NK553_15065 [Pseudomonas sp. ZM23]|uniref:Uncharacterized protein n=1 Tax=Pseudomonas triclosanedens TaxID=2961893 RepID=A0ABY6ZY97_9PSED|nr:hypothetical protein [Pseudomonas triclosanedens]MCP8465269.1 hypothetical protein [Pseudomonas triclosanedens]MCP8470791.1 hypothetical protein [Pseudomonas triclosanedens]MCP8476518.1 hypothetical protein [Pseudomonas triclosanedens]WAI48975.1 hypothetical protein OU419_25030 [Pseudomonas triclosanedens]